MEIRIHLPRPILTLSILAVIGLWSTGIISMHFPSTPTPQADAVGGVRPAVVIAQAHEDIDRERVKQAVFAQREEILRYQVQILETQALKDQTKESLQELQTNRAVLLSIIRQRTESEKLLQLSLEQLWDAQGTAYSDDGEGRILLAWPVEPLLGLSALFEDEAYVKRFGMQHHAIDIPTDQETDIRAPRNGTVLKVVNNGLGYSYVVLEHPDGMQTIFGHISQSLVQEGDAVHIGQIIAKSGGTPGTKGAGLLTTGPHLHFAVKVNGVLVDPLKYLPKM